MSRERERDLRNPSINRVTPARETELRSRAAEVSALLPGAQAVRIVSFDTTTGNPRHVISEAAPAEKGDYRKRALDFVQRISPTLGLEPTQPVEFVADPYIQQTSSGAVTVHLQQEYQGRPIFQAAQTVRFAPNGALRDATGTSITIAQEVKASPALSIQEAVRKAAEYVAVPQPDEQETTGPSGEPVHMKTIDLAGFVPKIIAMFPEKPDSPTVLEAGPFGAPIKAHLIWFPLNSDLRPAWEVTLTHELRNEMKQSKQTM